MYPNLRIELWKAGIRQNRLAKMLEMDETLLSRVVNGYRQASPQFRSKLAAILQRDETWLFEEAEHNPTAESAEAGTKASKDLGWSVDPRQTEPSQ